MVNFRHPRGRIVENGPHVVEVTVMDVSDGRTGRVYTPRPPVTVRRVLVQPSAGNALKAAETRTGNRALVDESVVRVLGVGQWPGGPHSVVRVVNGPYAGRSYQQAGHPSYWDASPMTRHFSVRLDSRGTEAR